MPKQIEKTTQKFKTFKWPEGDLEARFIELVKRYDPDLSMNQAIIKLIRQAVKEEHLPGYIRLERKKTVVLDDDAPEVIIPSLKTTLKKT